MRTLGLQTRCYAIDTWKGDEHAGFYGEEIFERVRQYNQKYYTAFSRLVRTTFDEAHSNFPDASIDLLHIDGRHFYEDVKHDFENWRTKLSERSVVLFHDTNVRERNFGVFQLWRELTADFPSFEFLHGHGLGVLGYGAKLPEEIGALFALRDRPNVTTQMRDAYSRLGAAIKADFEATEARSQLIAKLSSQEARASELTAKLEARDAETKILASKLEVQEARAEELKTSWNARTRRPRTWRQEARGAGNAGRGVEGEAGDA